MAGRASTPLLSGRMGPAVLAVTLLAAACGDAAGGGDQGSVRRPASRLTSCDGPPPGEPVAITLAHTEGSIREQALTDLVGEFERANPHVDVRLEHDAGGYGALADRWRDQRPAQRPHLTLLRQPASGRFIDGGQTLAPGDCLRATVPDLLPAVEAAWSAGGELRAVPFGVSTPVLMYNRSLFAAAGLDPDDPPATLDEVHDAARVMVDAGVAGKGLVFDTAADSNAEWLVEHVPAQAGDVALEPGNGRRRPAERVAWRDGTAVEVLAWLQGMLDEGLAVSVGRNTRGTENFYRAVQAGSYVAMTFHTNASLVELLAILDTGFIENVDLGVAPLPGPGGGGAGSLAGGSAFWLTADKPDRETAAAWRLVEFLASPPVQARWAAATGYVPISRSATTLEPLRSTWAQTPELRVAYDVLAAQGASPVEAGPLAGPQPEIHELLALALDDVVAGDDPGEALAGAADDADRLLAAYNASHPH